LLLESVLKEDSNCVDVGAYRGRVLAEIVRLAPHGKHIAYEPLPHIHKYLVDRFPSVDIRLAALGNETGERSFTYVKNETGRSGFREISYHKQPQIEKLTVRTGTLDSSLPDGYVPTLIKIDVEGAERLVLEGAIKTISKYKPIIVFEYGKGGAVHYGTQPRHIYELLHDEAGLRIFDLDGNGPYTLRQFEESYAQDDRWDYVARP
jgi:FkbM family methyltransferase